MRKGDKKDEKKPKGKLSKVIRKFLMAPLATSVVVATLTYGLAVLPVAVVVISYNAISDDGKKTEVDDGLTVNKVSCGCTIIGSGQGAGVTQEVDTTASAFPTYNLTDAQLIRLARLCHAEQGVGGEGGVKAEASLIASKYEDSVRKQGKSKAGEPWETKSLDYYADWSGWWHGTKGWTAAKAGRPDKDYMEKGSYTAQEVEWMRDVFVKGERTIPNYVMEHDNINEITRAVTDGAETPKRADAFVQGKTKLFNVYDSHYIFFAQPSPRSDPFGYIEADRARIERLGAVINVGDKKKVTTTVVADGSNGSNGSAGGGTATGSTGAVVTNGAGMATSGRLAEVHQNIYRIAMSHIGTRYVWGGSSWTSGADCSHETYMILKEAGGYNRGYVTSQVFLTLGPEVSLTELQAGDCLVSPGHVAIYIGNDMVFSSGQTGSVSYVKPASEYIGWFQRKGKRLQAVRVNEMIAIAQADAAAGNGSSTPQAQASGLTDGSFKVAVANEVSLRGQAPIDGTLVGITDGGTVSTNAGSVTGLSSGSTGAPIGASSTNSGSLGKRIDNAEQNKYGLPLYDNYTFNPDVYEHFDIDYSRFWNGSTPAGDVVYGGGDWKDNASKNILAWEYSDSYLRRHPNLRKFQKFIPDSESGAFGFRDGRLVMAVPYRLLCVNSDESTNWFETILPTKQANGRTGTSGDSPVIEPPSKIKRIEGTDGMYFDVVFDDGTVLGCMACDAMGLHTGVNHFDDGSSTTSFDKWSKGAFHTSVVGSVPNNTEAERTAANPKMRLNFFEILGAKDNNAMISQLKDFLRSGQKRIKSVRVYPTLLLKNGEQFASAGTNSSFGLTGGTAGRAVAGEDTTAQTGNSSGNTGLYANCTCSECHCHDNESSGVSGGPASSIVANTGKLTETAGMPQGVYWNKATNKQYTPQEVLDMFRTNFPNISSQYIPCFGLRDFTDLAVPADKLPEKFKDTRGVLGYAQGNQSWKGLKWIVAGLPYRDSFANDATFAQSSCGVHAQSIIISSLLHRYITPPEVVMAAIMSDKLGGDEHGAYSTGRVYAAMGFSRIYNSFKFNGENLFNVEFSETLSRDKLDSVLNAGGMVSVCVHRYWTRAGHFVVIATRDSDNKYYIVDSNASHLVKDTVPYDKGYTFDEIAQLGGVINQVNYVTPTEAYNQYLQSGSNSTAVSTSSGAGTSESATGATSNSSESANSESTTVEEEDE
jgi:cell wall-associated NlpC family hydrolase